MENCSSRIAAMNSGLFESATELEKSLFFSTVRENPVFFILYSIKESLRNESETKVAKAVARASFMMVDDLASRIRFGMKKGRREALECMGAGKLPHKCDPDKQDRIIDIYSLTIRRARRGRHALALILESIEHFYTQNPYEELMEVLILGTRGLAHIDIMISLYEEEMMLCCSSLADRQ